MLYAGARHSFWVEEPSPQRGARYSDPSVEEGGPLGRGLSRKYGHEC
jgi:hypothetical protein